MATSGTALPGRSQSRIVCYKSVGPDAQTLIQIQRHTAGAAMA